MRIRSTRILNVVVIAICNVFMNATVMSSHGGARKAYVDTRSKARRVVFVVARRGAFVDFAKFGIDSISRGAHFRGWTLVVSICGT